MSARLELDLAAGPGARPTVLSTANPLAKLAAVAILSTVLVLSVDIVSAGTALLLELAVLPFLGARWAALRLVLVPILLSAIFGGVAAVLVGVDSGAQLAALGPLTITEGSARTGVAIVLRVLAIALPGVMFVVTTDPTDLADALAQRARLPHRFVLGALAGLRLFAVLGQEWQSLTMARRARGLGDRRGPVGSLTVFLGQATALLVMAVRRGTRLAMAMEGRGFGAPGERTWARRSEFGPRDGWLVLGAAAAAGVAVGAGVAAGTWSIVWF